MSYVLFGHSFVKRLGGTKEFELKFKFGKESVSVSCYGEGGLSLARIEAKRRIYIRKLRKLAPRILIVDLGTNDLCAQDASPSGVYDKLCKFVQRITDEGIIPEAIVFLPVLPRTRGMFREQVSVEVFDRRASEFNGLVEARSFVEDRWWQWSHRGLKNPRYNLDGVHLNEIGRRQYQRTLRRVIAYFHAHLWK